MSDGTAPFAKLGTFRGVAEFQAYAAALEIDLPCDTTVLTSPESPLSRPIQAGRFGIANRFAIQPMEGWDGTLGGAPSERTFRRWQRFGRSGAKLIWGGEAVAVCPEGRANPNQLMLNADTQVEIGRLRETLVAEHILASGSADGLVIGLQLTHSGRYCRPNPAGVPEPRIAFRHPLLDRRLSLPDDYPVLSDGDLRSIVEQYGIAAGRAANVGFDFVDVKHCHGYLGHELLAAHTRAGDYGGPLENRTRFLREIVQAIRTEAPGLEIGVRVSAFDLIPFVQDLLRSAPNRPGPGVPEPHGHLLPYRYGFGVDAGDPTRIDLSETFEFFDLLRSLGITLVNVTGGSPYYNPHVQRPALYPPSDGYGPPEDPLFGVVRHMDVCRQLKARLPEMTFVGTGYSYLQEFLPNVAQAAVREEWTDFVGFGRAVLSYPEMAHDILATGRIDRRKLCRTFSDCTTAPRNGMPSGCYPLDPFYKQSPEHARLNELKRARHE